MNAAFPRVRAFRACGTQVTRLAELSADDAASAATHRLAAAGALLNLGSRTGVPAVALAAGSADAAQVRRLIEGPAAISKTCVTAVATTSAAVPLVPLVLLAGPVALAWWVGCCCR
jgi:hypothetical protein